jgi:hypothetical protein
MSIARITRQLLASAALAAGLALGLAAAATAQPTQSDKDADFLQCLVDHQDTDGIGVCCVFYGGDYDEDSGECWLDEAVTETKSPNTGPVRPTVKPGLPVLTQLPHAGVASR